MEHSLRFALGRLFWREAEERVELDFACKNDGQGLYKAWIAGSGAPLLLGTLLPEGSMLRLRRKLRRKTLEAKCCWPIQKAGAALAYHFRLGDGPQWQECAPAAWQITEPLAPLGEARGLLLREEPETGHWQLAIPFGTGEPFPLTALLCLCTVQRIHGAHYAVCTFDEWGRPKPPAC